MFELVALIIGGVIAIGAVILLFTVLGAALHLVFKVALIPLTLLMVVFKLVLGIVGVVIALVVVGPLLLVLIPLCLLALPFLLLCGAGCAACSVF